ncbi:NAD(P)-dependent oxidoreductase [Salinisphaera sp. Q1T1-3]|uniref:NAD(P)-dependent oxidoreductase n=1 Tax=Salinisphaera sp. Q1T1-3 TaxID=2321229 RepID=UPI000E770C40|nr:NAD(P)-dependent oxidoreductase [Salinisphaera sp. Q1T1-3]RJS93267.1 NAD(P)-dependent oxidoreductase [Salinisphaera sp. Q1T1-3]
MSHSIKIAVLGLGAMGSAFAENLCRAGFRVHVWNRTRDKAEPLVEHGAIVASTPHEAARNADVLITMVPDIEAVNSVLFDDDGALDALPDGAVLAQMGTLGVSETDALVARVASQRPDIVFIDAPVSGTKAPAEQGTVTVLASGDRDAALSRVQPVFDVIGQATHWLGSAGQGARVKIVVNAWLVATMQGVAETTLLARRLGLSTDDIWQALEGGPLANPYVENKLRMIGADDFSAQMALKWGLKDIELALEAGETDEMPALTRTRDIWRQAAAEASLADQDIAVISRYLTHPG